MSMYVIYPADELIQFLLAREYSVPNSTGRSLSSLSPVVPPLAITEASDSVRTREKNNSKNSTSTTSVIPALSSVKNFDIPATVQVKADTTVATKKSKKPLSFDLNSITPISNNIGPSLPVSNVLTTTAVTTQKYIFKNNHSSSNQIPGSSTAAANTVVQILQTPSIIVSYPPLPPPPPLLPPTRKKTKTWKKQTDKVHPLENDILQNSLGTTNPSIIVPRPRFTFERIAEETEGDFTEDDDEFFHFRKTNTSCRLSVKDKKVSPSVSPTLSIKSWKFSVGGGKNKSSISTSGQNMANSILGGGAKGIEQSGKDAFSSSGLSGLSDTASLKDMLHPTLNESLKSHNALSFKLIRIVSDFTQQLSQLHEQHAVELQRLVENFRKRNAEIRKERPPCSNSLFQVWETLLQEVEIDSQAHSDISGSLGRQVARQLLEKTFCRKIQSRKIFAHRESFETVLSKAEGVLSNAYREYCEACQLHVQHGSSNTLSQYYEAHNAYVQQLRGTNAMLKEYQSETLPALLQELEDIYMELCTALSDSILQGADIINVRGQETGRRYESLTTVCRNVNGLQDLREYAKCVTAIPLPNQRHAFTLPAPLRPTLESGDISTIQDQSHVPVLKDEVVQDRLSSTSLRSRHESLKKEMGELESEMRQLQDSLDALIRMQQRSLDSNLFNKANELQEEISMKRFDLRVAQMHLSALKAQKDLYSTKSSDGGGPTGSGGESSSSISSGPRDRKMSVASTASMKSKWLNAFRSLKTPAPPQPSPPPREFFDKKNGKEKDNKESFQIFENHIFQEYTYKKITPCDICSKILRGHTRQGLRCRMCKTNVHIDCQEKVGKCQPKTRLLRRQRSTSELETRLTQLAETDGPQRQQQQPTSKPNDEPDLIYQVLKQATDMKKPSGPSGGGGGGSNGSANGSGGGGNGIHGSSQTLHSQQEFGVFGGASGNRRSNPTVNVIGNSSHSGSTTPALAAAQAATFHPSSSDESKNTKQSQRRDSYVSRKSISADADGPSPALFLLPPPRAVSLPSTQTPHSPRRRKLDLRMKSFSLDSPESTEHAQRRRYAHGSQSTSHSQYWRLLYANTSGIALDGMLHSRSRSTPNATTRYASSSTSTRHLLDFYNYYSSPQTPINYCAPSSPVHNRRALLTARNVRMSSVELPDENDKSLSSASTSPCPSPKPHRLLPTNLYVVLYMFKARHPDELDLKSGNKVTVTDTTDPDWWQGKCMGHTGYFPSKYVTKLHSSERPLQVTHNLQVTDGAENGLKLLRDQIVIQVGEELDGMVTIRNGDNKQGVCPLKYLQEV